MPLKLFIYTVALFIALAGITLSQTTQPLFLIERNTNKNKVYYEARITPDGVIDTQDPVHSYWILWEKDSSGRTHEELSLLEKNMAYGVKIKRNPGKNNYTVSLAAFPERAIMVHQDNGKAVAEVILGGKLSLLEKVYINARQTKMFPKVNYIELFGVDPKTAEARYEKIIPK